MLSIKNRDCCEAIQMTSEMNSLPSNAYACQLEGTV